VVVESGGAETPIINQIIIWKQNDKR